MNDAEEMRTDNHFEPMFCGFCLCFSQQHYWLLSLFVYFNIFINWTLSVFTSWSYLKWKVKFHKSRIDNKYVHESNSTIVPIHNTKLFIFNSNQGVKSVSSPWMKHGKTNPEGGLASKSITKQTLPSVIVTKPFHVKLLQKHVVPQHRYQRR